MSRALIGFACSFETVDGKQRLSSISLFMLGQVRELFLPVSCNTHADSSPRI